METITITSKKGTTYQISNIRQRFDKTFSANAEVVGVSGMKLPDIFLYFDEQKNLIDYGGIPRLPEGVLRVTKKAGFIVPSRF